MAKPAGSRLAGCPLARHQLAGRPGRACRAAVVKASQPITPPGWTAAAAVAKTAVSQKPVHRTSA
jgi:hypothetical protein